MPFSRCPVPHKGCLHFRRSTRNIYAGFLLLLHLSHLCCLLINLREARSIIFSTFCPCYPGLSIAPGHGVGNRMETTTRPSSSPEIFQRSGKSWQYAYFCAPSLHTPTPTTAYLQGCCSALPGALALRWGQHLLPHQLLHGAAELHWAGTPPPSLAPGTASQTGATEITWAAAFCLEHVFVFWSTWYMWLLKKSHC